MLTMAVQREKPQEYSMVLLRTLNLSARLQVAESDGAAGYTYYRFWDLCP